MFVIKLMLQFSQFVWTPCYSVWDVFKNFSTDRSKISSDIKRFFIALSLYPLSFFANTPFKAWKRLSDIYFLPCILPGCCFEKLNSFTELRPTLLWVPLLRVQVEVSMKLLETNTLKDTLIVIRTGDIEPEQQNNIN